MFIYIFLALFDYKVFHVIRISGKSEHLLMMMLLLMMMMKKEKKDDGGMTVKKYEGEDEGKILFENTVFYVIINSYWCWI